MTLSLGGRTLWAVVLVAWSARLVGGLASMGLGLHQTVYFEPTGEAVRAARVGNLLILAGSLALFFAAGWARWMHTPIWACILVGTPAVLSGGLSLFFGGTLLPQVSALVAFPAGIAGLIGGLILARPLREAMSCPL